MGAAGDSEAGLGVGGSRRGRRIVREAEEAAWQAILQLGVQMGCWAPLLGATPERRTSPRLGSQSWGSDSRNAHLHPMAGLENIRWHCSPKESSPHTPAEMPQGTALFLAGLGVGLTDRQTEMFSCRLFGYWLKAPRDGNAFAVI